MERETTIISLPTSLMIEILKRMAAKSLGSCMMVCKAWRSLIVSPGFSNTLHHHRRTTFTSTHCVAFQAAFCKFLLYYAPGQYKVISNTVIVGNNPNDDDDGSIRVKVYHEDDYTCSYSYNGQKLIPHHPIPRVENNVNVTENKHFLELVGYCDGVACLLDHSRKPIYCDDDDYDNVRRWPHLTTRIVLWNPSIRTSLTLGNYPNGQDPAPGELIFGFGYDPASLDYKAVRVTCNCILGAVGIGLRAEIYSLGAQTWTTYEEARARVARPSRKSVYFNGRIHWTCCVGGGNGQYSILAFDLAAPHGFHEIPIPEVIAGSRGRPRLIVPKVAREMAVGLSLDMGTWGPGERVHEYLGLLSGRDQLWVMEKYHVATGASLWRRLVAKTPNELPIIDVIGPLDMDMDAGMGKGTTGIDTDMDIDLFGIRRFFRRCEDMDQFGRRFRREDQLMVLENGRGGETLYHLNTCSATSGVMKKQEQRFIGFHLHGGFHYLLAFEESLVLLQYAMNV